MQIDLNNLTGEVGVHHERNEVHHGYEKLIQQFLYEHVQYTAPNDVRFEAISAAIFGTKQRRYGPMPSPEIQAQVRQAIRDSRDHIKFFVPWGGRKQVDGANLDIMEFMALKQLACLQEDLLRYGVTSEFHVRIEDLTDYWLFDDEHASNNQVDLYSKTLIKLGQLIMKPGTWLAQRETALGSKRVFFDLATRYQGLFYSYLQGNDGAAFRQLMNDGWMYPVDSEQRDYYYRQYESFYPNTDHVMRLAQYFASVLARKQMNLTYIPEDPYIFLTFAHPIPGTLGTKLYYRSLPQRFTNNHRSPWLATGYVEIHEDNSICPKSLGFGENPELIHSTIDINGVPVDVPYILV